MAILVFVVFTLLSIKYTRLYYSRILPELEDLRIKSGIPKYEAIALSNKGYYPPKFIQDILEHEELSKKLELPPINYNQLKNIYKFRYLILIIYFMIFIAIAV